MTPRARKRGRPGFAYNRGSAPTSPMNPDADQLWTAPRWALRRAARPAGHARALLHRHLHPGVLRHRAGAGRHAGGDAADAVGLPVRLCLHEPVPRRAGRTASAAGRWCCGASRSSPLASAGCALSQSIGQLVFFRALQGLSTGAGIVVSRAVIRDMFPPAQAQKVMSQVTIYFGVAPAIAPIIGGWLFVHAGWHSIFWFLTAVGVALWLANCRLLPETLHVDAAPAVQRAQPDARLLAAGLQPALPAAGAGQRHPLQRHVPLRAVGARVPGRAPAASRRRSSSGSSCSPSAASWPAPSPAAGWPAGSRPSGRSATASS